MRSTKLKIQIKIRNLINEQDPQFIITSLPWHSAFNLINHHEKWNPITFCHCSIFDGTSVEMSINLVKTCCFPPRFLIDIFKESKPITIGNWKFLISFVDQHTKLRLIRDRPYKGWVVQKSVTRLVKCTKNTIWFYLLRHKLKKKIVRYETLHISCTIRRPPAPLKIN